MIGKDNIAAKVIESGGKLSVKSALNPMLWLCAIITIPSLLAVPFIDSIPTWMIILIIAPVLTSILGFFFLLIFDRDKLQSEEYQLKKKSMELIQIKGQDQPSIVNYEQIAAIINPQIIKIEKTGEDK
jgi:hypothetical protein